MPEWKRLIPHQLALLRLTPEAAQARVLEEIADWPALERELSALN